MARSLEQLARALFERLFKKSLREIFKKKPAPPKDTDSKELSHPWRLCPVGEGWVRTHPLTVPASDRGPEHETIRRGHCRRRKGGKNICTADELREIADLHFKELAKNADVMPTRGALDFPNESKYDLSIAGWTMFWNETLQPEILLTPDFVKALIATESGFEIPKDTRSKVGLARGLIQITEQARKILQNPKGELKDYLIEMSIEESREPEVNISAGIRWLHHKKFLAKHRLKREATWEEAVAEYKGILPQLGRVKRSNKIMKELEEYLDSLTTKRLEK